MAKAQRQAQQTDLSPIFRTKVVEETAKTIRTALVFGSALGIAYCFAGMVHDLAGKKTAADIGFTLLGTINISEGLAWAIAVICGGIAIKRERTNSSMAARLARLAEFERTIDPNRSSSHLTVGGKPCEEDK
ncbi:MAG: hypothetical protein ABI972_19260 [Acidobacteriota bacterium]